MEQGSTTADPLLEQAIKFLQHSSTQSTPISGRVAFLKQKGLTDAQVANALQRCGLSESQSQSTGSEAPLARDNAGIPWFSWLLGGGAGAAAAMALARNSTLSERLSAADEEITAVRSQLENLADVSRELLQQHTRRLDEFDDGHDALLRRLNELNASLAPPGK